MSTRMMHTRWINQVWKSDEEDDYQIYQILGDTDDELEAFGLPNHLPKVKDFNNRHGRTSWCMGLVLLPSDMCFGMELHLRPSQNGDVQWQGDQNPGVHTGLSSTWGGTTKRSEREALIRVLRSIIQAHIAPKPKDEDIWKVQLEKIQKA